MPRFYHRTAKPCGYESKETMKRLIDEYQVDIISIGNGTASRESEQFVADVLREVDRKVEICHCERAGASVNSASELGTKGNTLI
jgi:uncharacterized protein